MIKCPNCLHEEMEGAIFCKECGAPLINGEEFNTTDIKMSTGFDLKSMEEQILPVVETANPFTDAFATFHLLGKDIFLPIQESEEVIIGRAGEGQSMLPDIDLNQYQAFESGVSRLHAAVRVVEDQVIITDLGSSNGTSVNGLKIEPKVPYTLKNGDVICLGKLKLEVITQKKTNN